MPKSIRFNRCRTAAIFVVSAYSLAHAPAALAREGLDLSGVYIAELAITPAGGTDSKVRYLDNLGLTLDADLAPLLGISNTTVRINVISNAGAQPSESAPTLEGFHNIEVARDAVRLFEAWAEHSFGDSSVKLGMYDLNSEFYFTKSSTLLLAPPFGFGSEITGTGRNGPSIFPSSSLTLRLKTALPVAGGYAQVAVLNARAQTLGDPGGIDLSFDDGLLAIGEVGVGERLRGALGVWSYTRPSDALASLTATGEPLRARTAGIYAMTEYNFTPGGPRDITAFLSSGVADGRSNLFTHALNAGVLVSPVIPGRKASALSVGFRHVTTSSEFRRAAVLAGEVPWHQENALELTYSDAITPFLSLQPNIQINHMSDGSGNSSTALHATARITFSF
jgi:porin